MYYAYGWIGFLVLLILSLILTHVLGNRSRIPKAARVTGTVGDEELGEFDEEAELGSPDDDFAEAPVEMEGEAAAEAVDDFGAFEEEFK